MLTLNRPPFGARAIDKAGSFTTSWVDWFTRLWVAQQDSVGLTRPTENLKIGKMHLDLTLGKPIWVLSLGPTVWIDATGAVV